MFTVKNDLKQAGILRTNRPQSTKLPFGSNRLVDTVQQPIRRCPQSDYRKRGQIAGVSGAAQFRTAADIGDAFAQRQPFHYRLTLTQTLTSDAETSGVVNGCLNPQHAALLVVHFDRVLFNPVFQSNTFHSSVQITIDFTSK